MPSDDRQASILRAVVQLYIESSQPVSSSQVTHASGVNASPATVRTEMATLEREGYLHQPHTSAGRVPTDRGYRFFVDQLSTDAKLGRAQAQDVRTFFAAASGEIEQMLHETGRLLSNLTGSAALVVGPDHEMNTIRSAQLVALGPHMALVVLVFSNGAVDKHSVSLDAQVTDAVVAAASVRLNSHLDGKALGETTSISPGGNEEVDALVMRALDTVQSAHRQGVEDNVFVGGTSRLAAAFDAVETVRNVLAILEQQYVVVTLIRNLVDKGMNVSIGTENELQPLAHCSLVVAPTIVEGEQRGSVAVLGPTRMDYSQAMAAVTIVSQRLGERLSQPGK